MHLLRRAGFWRPRLEVQPAGVREMSDALGLADAATISVYRARRLEDQLRLGPNEVHAMIIHPDGSFDDLGVSPNLLTNSGRDLVAAALGSLGTGISSTAATATSATSLTGSGFTSNQYQGWTVIAEESTNAPVSGNIGSNTTTVLTVDQWWNADGSTGNTPGATANYAIYPTCRPIFIGLTTDAAAASATDTVLASEITTGGVNRQRGTYAHTAGTNTLTLTKSFSVTSSFTNIHKAGAFTASTSTAGGIMVFESVLNADATVVNGDTLQITWTYTLS